MSGKKSKSGAKSNTLKIREAAGVNRRPLVEYDMGGDTDESDFVVESSVGDNQSIAATQDRSEAGSTDYNSYSTG